MDTRTVGVPSKSRLPLAIELTTRVATPGPVVSCPTGVSHIVSPTCLTKCPVTGFVGRVDVGAVVDAGLVVRTTCCVLGVEAVEAPTAVVGPLLPQALRADARNAVPTSVRNERLAGLPTGGSGCSAINNLFPPSSRSDRECIYRRDASRRC